MKMHNPPHPGEVLRELCLEPLNLTVTEAAEALGVDDFVRWSLIPISYLGGLLWMLITTGRIVLGKGMELLVFSLSGSRGIAREGGGRFAGTFGRVDYIVRISVVRF